MAQHLLIRSTNFRVLYIIVILGPNSQGNTLGSIVVHKKCSRQEPVWPLHQPSVMSYKKNVTWFSKLWHIQINSDILGSSVVHKKCPRQQPVWPLHHWMTIPKFWPKLIPRLFFRYPFFRNWDFFSWSKFSETETETFFPRPNSPKPKPRLFSETKFFRNWNRDFFSETKFFETETLKNLAKVLRPRPKPRLLNIFWNEIRKIRDLQAKLEFLGPKFGTLIVKWVKSISAR